MTSKTSALNYCRLQESDHAQLTDVVSSVLIEGNSLNADKYDSDKWLWKYFVMPHAEPRIYVCKEGNEIIGYYHCPVYAGILNGLEKKIAVVQDVGVTQAARGKGVFGNLAKFVHEDLSGSDVNVILTFPNKKSIHTFLKYNAYSPMQVYSAFIVPIKSGKILAAKFKFIGLEKVFGKLGDFVYRLVSPSVKNKFSIRSEKQITPEIVEVFSSFNAGFKNKVKRDYDFLNWRFEQKPHGKHYYFTAKNESEVVAVAIFSIEELLGSMSAILIDFAVKDSYETAFTELIAQLRKNHSIFFEEPISLLFASCIGNHIKLLKKSGFLKIPQKLNPRPLHLLGKNISENPEVLDVQDWNITLSEWDVL